MMFVLPNVLSAIMLKNVKLSNGNVRLHMTVLTVRNISSSLHNTLYVKTSILVYIDSSGQS